MDWQGLVKRAEEFHGHGGPFLLLGLRIGILAVEKLGDGYGKKLKAEVHCPLKTPYSCMIDGIQISTGCTRGKRNIDEVEDKNFFVVFSSENKSIKIMVHPGVNLDDFIGSWDELEKKANLLSNTPVNQLLKVEVI
jgi:formylmethanofuran dehydrogenase subunit E